MGIDNGTILQSPKPNPSSKRVVWALAIILLLAVLLGVGGYFWTRKQPQPVQKVQTTIAPPVVPAPPTLESIKNTVQFEFDKSTLSAAEQEKVKAFWENLGAKPGQITIAAYTCNMGPDWYNYWLSKRRAKSVAQLLAVPNGYAVKTEAYGRNQPIADNSTKEGRAANRRAEIVLILGP